MKLKKFRAPSDDCYGWARLCQVIGNYFGGSLSLGIDTVDRLDMDNWDNGVYIIDGWDIVGREYFDGIEQQSYNVDDMLEEIDIRQPLGDQLGKQFLSAKEVKRSQIETGDKVYVYGLSGNYDLCEVCGFGRGVVNGRDVTGVPYVGLYGDDFAKNINNYLLDDIYRVVGS